MRTSSKDHQLLGRSLAVSYGALVQNPRRWLAGLAPRSSATMHCGRSTRRPSTTISPRMSLADRPRDQPSSTLPSCLEARLASVRRSVFAHRAIMCRERRDLGVNRTKRYGVSFEMRCSPASPKRGSACLLSSLGMDYVNPDRQTRKNNDDPGPFLILTQSRDAHGGSLSRVGARLRQLCFVRTETDGAQLVDAPSTLKLNAQLRIVRTYSSRVCQQRDSLQR
jgi:hypothetical protein